VGDQKVIGYDTIYALVILFRYGAKKRNQPPHLNASELSRVHDVDLSLPCTCLNTLYHTLLLDVLSIALVAVGIVSDTTI